MEDLTCFGTVSSSVSEGLEPVCKFMLSPGNHALNVSSSCILLAACLNEDNKGDFQSDGLNQVLQYSITH